LNTINKVCVIGLGHIGLPTALVLSEAGYQVHGVDVNDQTVSALGKGEATIVEPGIDELLKTNTEKQNFTVSSSTTAADVFIIAVPTPLSQDQTADLSYIFSAIDAAIPNLNGEELLINESTCPPGTTEAIAEHIVSVRPDLTLEPNRPNSIYLAHCPERVIPGKTLRELKSNSRIVGGFNSQSSSLAKQLYESFCSGEILLTDIKTAELVKLAENAFRDVNIAFANELSGVADRLGINVWEVIKLANHHPRVNILKPGPGVGGHCIAVDPWFIHQAAPSITPLVKLSREVNDRRPKEFARKIISELAPIRNAKICVLGLAFKANVEDLRESPAIKVVMGLAHKLPNAEFLIVEPHINQLPDNLEKFSNLSLVSSPSDWEAFDAVLVLTDHDEFSDIPVPDPSRILVFDSRGFWEE